MYLWFCVLCSIYRVSDLVDVEFAICAWPRIADIAAARTGTCSSRAIIVCLISPNSIL